MADYISRRAAILAIRRREKENEDWAGYPETMGISTDLSDAIDAIKSVKSADVRPVVHGGWRPNPRNPFWLNCTVCGYGKPDRAVFNFCPNCGADMRGGEY